MIPYIYSNKQVKGKDNIVNCSADLVILDDKKPLLISLTDISIKNKKVASDIIGDGWKTVILKDRENTRFNKELSIWGDDSYRYKSDRLGDNTHTVIYHNNINEYCIDWNNDGKIKVITKWLRNRKYLPITEEIVQEIVDLDDSKSYYNIFTECDVYTNNPDFEDLKVYKINHHWFMQELEKLKAEEDDYNWDEIETIEDYIFTFLEPIKDKLYENMTVLYNPKKINKDIYNGIKPFKGQVPLIQSGIEVLNRDRFIYMAAEMGVGKSIIGSKVNHVYHKQKGKDNYITLLIAPAITLSQWKDELKKSTNDDIDIHIFKKTDEFIRWYNKTEMQVDKPTYILVGKETLKLSYKKRAGVIPKKRTIKRTTKDDYWYNRVSSSSSLAYTTKEDEIEVTLCPDCGVPLKNPLRKTEDVYFTEKDFKGNPKKSNYKCTNCGAVLWQATYVKTRKTSVADFIKRKGIIFDSIIVDEAHEGNGDSLIGTTVRTLIRNHAKKVLLLSGTSNNGYSSSLYNLCLALMPRTLIDNNVLEEDSFIRTYGTLQAVNKIKDGEYRSSGRNQLKESDFKEVEGINPLFFTKFLSQNFIFATLDDIKDDLPPLIEEYIPVNQMDILKTSETRLFNDIKSANALNAEWYNDTIIKHYINNPYNWSKIEISANEIEKSVQPSNLLDDVVLPKEQVLFDIVLKELEEGRKCWIYTDFTGGGKYMKGETIPERLVKMFEDNGIKVYHLKASTTTYERRDIIEKNKDKYDVFISNPKLVNVGVNLLFCPTYIVYTPSYHVNITSQAIKRGYRANSTVENRVYHLYYKDTVEDKVIKRYQRKVAESRSIEGKFNVNLENETDIRTASSFGKRIADGISK